MPAVRTVQLNLSSFRYQGPGADSKSTTRQKSASLDSGLDEPDDTEEILLVKEFHDFAKCDIDYPLTPAARAAYRTDTGKRVPPHHWDVYDLVRRIPAGKVSTYKDVCAALGTGSARSVGGALRNNPFAPFVPCHRVVAADMGVGGFRGEWKGVSKEKSQSVPAAEKIQVERNWHEKYKGTGLGNVQKEKVKMLVLEGVAFDERMRVKGGEDVVWRAAMFEPDSA